MADTMMVAGDIAKTTIYDSVAGPGMGWASMGLLVAVFLFGVFRYSRHVSMSELLVRNMGHQANLQMGSLLHIALSLAASFTWFFYGMFVFYGQDTTTIDTGYGFWIAGSVANFCLFLIYHLRPLSNSAVRYIKIGDSVKDQTLGYLANLATPAVFFLAWNVGLVVLFYLQATAALFVGIPLIAITALYLGFVCMYIYTAFTDNYLTVERYWVLSVGIIWMLFLAAYSLMVILSPVIGNVITYNQLGTAYVFLAMGSVFIFVIADTAWEGFRIRSRPMFKPGKRM